MKIGLVSARFPPAQSGIGDYTLFLADALSRLGCEVNVVTSAGGADGLPPLLPDNVHVHRVVQAWGLRSLWGLRETLRKLDVDAVVLEYAPHAFDRRGITFGINVLPLLLRGKTRFKVVTNFHELYIPLAGSLQRLAGGLWQRGMAILMAYGSQSLSVTTTDWKRRLRRLGVFKPVEVIPVGSNIPPVPVTESERLATRKRILGGHDGLLLGGFGALHDRDVQLVLEAMSHVNHVCRTKLVWIGGGDGLARYRTTLEQAVSKNGLEADDVYWTGNLSPPDVSKTLTVCDIMVLPFVDGISTRRTTAVTALQHGLPILTTRGRSHDPCFVHGQNVYLASATDRRSFSSALETLVSTPELRARLSQGAVALYQSQFTWERIAGLVTHGAGGN